MCVYVCMCAFRIREKIKVVIVVYKLKIINHKSFNSPAKSINVAQNQLLCREIYR